MARFKEMKILSGPLRAEPVAKGKGVVVRRGLKEVGGKSRT
jgi:hypothetical protein